MIQICVDHFDRLIYCRPLVAKAILSKIYFEIFYNLTVMISLDQLNPQCKNKFICQLDKQYKEKAVVLLQKQRLSDQEIRDLKKSIKNIKK